ncbi:hypothetical protein ES288_D10G287400v1 [Gossypium darwinii]|uniref:Uncharacterized protein n=1 Tax=Gossypium darwinii TaxID=34276 RepID=A0A5D2B5L3_GOSDA|nr:hypothetical protein ES288_D10G287400v1 [Gossypium darwinii]
MHRTSGGLDSASLFSFQHWCHLVSQYLLHFPSMISRSIRKIGYLCHC